MAAERLKVGKIHLTNAELQESLKDFHRNTKCNTFVRDINYLKIKISEGIVKDPVLVYENLILKCSPYGEDKRSRGNNKRNKK